MPAARRATPSLGAPANGPAMPGVAIRLVEFIHNLRTINILYNT